MYNDLNIQKVKNENILNSQHNIVIVTNAKYIQEANKAFCDFFSFKNLEEFKKSHNCICEHFIEEDSYLKTNMGDLTWVDYILENPDILNLAKIRKDDKEFIFKVLIKKMNSSFFKQNECLVTFVDITNEIQREDLLKKHLLYNQALSENSPICLFLGSNSRVILDINKAAVCTFGYSKKELLNKSFEEIHISKEKFLEFKDIYEKITNNIVSDIEYPFKHKNGKEIWCSLNVVKIFVENETPTIIWSFVDITEQKKFEKELIEQKNIAIEANNIKNQFLANISHELRTPMNAIIGLSDLSLDTKLDENQYNLLSSINSSSKLLLSIIDDILDITKIESGKISLDKQAFNLDNIPKKLKTIFFESSIKKDLDFILLIDPDLPKVIFSDESRILQILTNFLSNAFKFTIKGKIKTEIKLLEKISNHKAKIKFSVSDTGIGISENIKNNMFEPFVQADISNTRKYGGSGLGLSISKKIVQTLNSNIELQSRENEGSCFSFIVDFDVLDWENELDENKASCEKSDGINTLSGLKILLVEDNEINQEVASMILKKANIEVDIANNGLEAVEIYRKNQGKYDLILMDLQMPILSGYDATIQIRQFDKVVPIIALTAAVMLEDKEKVLEVGMNDHLAKPIDKNALFNTIIKHTKKIKNKDFVFIQKENNFENGTLNRKMLEDTLSTKELIDKLLLKFLQQLNEEFKDIVEEIILDTQNARFLVHGLKGTSGNLGAESLYSICQKIDNKYKKSLTISSLDIETLQTELLKIRDELKYLEDLDLKNNSEFINLLNDDDFIVLLDTTIAKLTSGDILDQEFLNILYLNMELKSQTSINDLSTLKSFIDDFEYYEAIDFLNNFKLSFKTI